MHPPCSQPHHQNAVPILLNAVLVLAILSQTQPEITEPALSNPRSLLSGTSDWAGEQSPTSLLAPLRLGKSLKESPWSFRCFLQTLLVFLSLHLIPSEGRTEQTWGNRRETGPCTGQESGASRGRWNGKGLNMGCMHPGVLLCIKYPKERETHSQVVRPCE